MTNSVSASPIMPSALSLKSEIDRYTCQSERDVDPADYDFNNYFGDMSFFSSEQRESLARVLSHSLHWTLRCEGRILCLFGATPVWHGMWNAFLMPTARMQGHAGAVVRTIRNTLKAAAGEYYGRRLQTTVDLNRPKAVRFALALGFRPEATLRRYGPEGQDHVLMAMLFEEQ